MNSMVSTFCVTGSSQNRPVVQATGNGVRIHMAGVALFWDWATANAIVQEIDRLRTLEKRRIALEKFPEVP